MKNSLVRINSVQLTGFKNTLSGVVEMPSAIRKDWLSEKSDILGIYGQNGSGKTAIIEAIDFVQTLLMGRSLPEDTVQYISHETNSCSIAVAFAVDFRGKRARVEYSVELTRLSKDDFAISRETLSTSTWDGERFESKRALFSFSDGNAEFAPQYRYNDITSDVEDGKINLKVASILAQKEHKSFIFSKEALAIFMAASEGVREDYEFILHALHGYANINLFTISNAHSGSISMNFLLPIAFRFDGGDIVTKGDLPVRLDRPTVVSKKKYDIVRQVIVEMNVVLKTIIPGLTIDVHDFGEQLGKDGESEYSIELISRRGDTVIPLKYESEGIIKIISILNVLMHVYNDPSMCLVIDELDAGIYEYLLGELLEVFDKGAKGQLIFTSHNLRALEMLDKTSIVFSTTNPSQRYMRLQNVKTNNNLRDMYLRSITLGGQKEDVYAETDSVDIGRAFRRAGRIGRSG